MAALVFKVAALTIRTVAKPLASRFETWILSHDTARSRIIQLAQAVHSVEVAISRGAEGKSGKAFVGAMSDEKALNMASRIVSEGFIFLVSAGTIAWEYNRSKTADAKKQAEKERRKAAFKRLEDLERRRLQEENARQFAMLHNLCDRMSKLEIELSEFRKQQLEQQQRMRWSLFSSSQPSKPPPPAKQPAAAANIAAAT